MRMRRATEVDWPAIWPIWHAVVATGTTYLWLPDTSEEDARRHWMLPPPAEVWLAVSSVPDSGERILGTALLRPNWPGLGAHVANAGFMVAPDAEGQGVGRALASCVVDRARACGYRGMQFNAVVATNTRALALWTSLGFDVIGTIPGGFQHATQGYVDLHIMYRSLSDPGPE